MEICFNVWLYLDTRSNLIQRLAARAYVLDGDDDSKLAVLHSLAKTDFYASQWRPVPKNFTVNGGPDRILNGAVSISSLRDETTSDALLESVMQETLNDMPTQLRDVNGEYQTFRLPSPNPTLHVTTIVKELPDGSLTPVT